MKLSICSILLLASTITMISCSNPTLEKAYTIDPGILTPADSAKKDIADFDFLCKNYLYVKGADGSFAPLSIVPIKAFTVQSKDLLAAMGIFDREPTPEQSYIRAYLGYNVALNQFKLYIVPVDWANPADSMRGVDLLVDSNGQQTYPANPGEPLTNMYVLDLNAPCPNLCDNNSPLTIPSTIMDTTNKK